MALFESTIRVEFSDESKYLMNRLIKALESFDKKLSREEIEEELDNIIKGVKIL